jgi:hypothetical protein
VFQTPERFRLAQSRRGKWDQREVFSGEHVSVESKCELMRAVECSGLRRGDPDDAPGWLKAGAALVDLAAARDQ